MFPRRALPWLAACLVVVSLPACKLPGSRGNAPGADDPYRRRFGVAFDLAVGGECKEAIEHLLPLAEDAGRKNEVRDDATFWLAYCYQELGRTEDARRMYRALIENFPDSGYVNSARERLREDVLATGGTYSRRFGVAFNLAVGGEYEKAIEHLLPLAEDADRGNEVRADATFWLAHCYQELGRTEDAVRTYRALIENFPDSPYVNSARERLAAIRSRPSGKEPAPVPGEKDTRAE